MTTEGKDSDQMVNIRSIPIENIRYTRESDAVFAVRGQHTCERNGGRIGPGTGTPLPLGSIPTIDAPADDHQDPVGAESSTESVSNFVGGSDIFPFRNAEEDKKKTEGWKADADGILIFVSRTRSPGHAILRRLPHAEQPSSVDAAPLKTATHLFDRLREGRHGLCGDRAVPLGDAPVSRNARRTAQRRNARLVCVRAPQEARPVNQRPGRARAQEPLPWWRYQRIPTASATVPPPRRPIRAHTPDSPRSPVVDGEGSGPGTFSVEAFALLVQALIADDRALMGRLIRFAQAHDLLKKNAERAQKFAQDSNAALETYQRQEQIEQLAAEKLAVEERAAEQAETLRQLTEANGVLSARALQLAEDAAAVQEELRAVNTVSEREQTQRLALLEEINLVQTENGSLRQQLRALGKL
ncbi:hypothetical protein EDB83DRAFT_2322667 [Lactarius deliciosus]|nr:hypothetical protein EDB83DRAFT_2322667 [Lactarius deliciosus]